MYVHFLILSLAGLAGTFGVALSDFIRRKKSANEEIICPAGFDCQTVVNSKYSKFLGIPVENLGIFYYLIIALSYASFLVFPGWHHEFFSFFILAITTLAFLFSIYLTYIQIVVLKQWCTFCLISLVLCVIIFISAWVATDFDLIAFLNSVIQHLSFI